MTSPSYADASARSPRMAVYAGVFDPPTMAHMEIIENALRIFDELTVVVAVNPNKSGALFTPEERVEMLDASLGEMRGRVRVTAYAGLIAPYAERLGACALVRGMRPYADADAEIALALGNQALAPDLPTVLLVASRENVYLSSTFVRDWARMGGLIMPGSVPPPVEQALRARFVAPVHADADAEANADAEAEAEAEAGSDGKRAALTTEP